MKALRRWLRKVLRELLEEDQPVSRELKVHENTSSGLTTTTYLITGVERVALIGSSMDGESSGVRAIRPDDAADADHFWKLWHELSPNVSVTWEDGTPVKPGRYQVDEAE